MRRGNIFSVLAKYDSTTASENYLTETLVFVVNSLLDSSVDRPLGVQLLNQLYADGTFSFDVGESIDVSTQEAIDRGILDIQIMCPGKLMFVEVKDHSPVRLEQLDHYKRVLSLRKETVKRLVLITRNSVDSSEHGDFPDVRLLWLDIHARLENLKPQDAVNLYLIDSLVSFLKENGMTIEKVGWEYVNGVRAFNSLFKMVEAGLTNNGLKVWQTGISIRGEYYGLYFDRGDYWCGISYDEPQVLILEMQRPAEYDKKAATTAYDLDDTMSGLVRLSLNLEDVHFFSLDKTKQSEEITKFLKQAYADAQKMRIPKP